MRVLLSFALEMEFAPWRRIRRFARLASNVPEFSARVGENYLRVVLTGMGTTAARRVALLALAHPADVCIVAGLAGALRDGPRHGEILAASSVREAETHRLLKSDDALLRAAVSAGARECDLCTSKYVLAAARDKRRMAVLGDIVDMESFVVMEEAQSRGIPAIALRAISDLADEDLPFDFTDAVNARGEIQPWRAAAMALQSPARLPKLLRLAFHSGQAARMLARFLDSFTAGLADSRLTPESGPGEASGNAP